MRPFDMSDPSSDDAEKISGWVHWLAPHWGYLLSLLFAAMGIVWRAASLFNEIKALRRDQDRTTVAIQAFMTEYRSDSLAWRTYVDGKFNAVNDRLDNLADK